jgi:hypothetical protein
MAKTGHSLQVQTGLVNLKEADVQSADPVFPMCKRNEGPQRVFAIPLFMPVLPYFQGCRAKCLQI